MLPSLAVAVGLNEALLLQQIHYWLQRSTTRIGGHVWVYNSVRQWRDQFPFWSDDTIARGLKSLRSRGVIVAEALSQDPRDRSLYYRIDYSAMPECITAICGNGHTQIAAISNRTETTSEIPPVSPKGDTTDAVEVKAKRQRLKLKTLSEYIETIPPDEYVIKPTDVIYDRGVPAEMIQLAWLAFKERYTTNENHSGKRYKSWVQAFRDHVDGNFLRLWYVDASGQYVLTTVGAQAHARLCGGIS